MWYYFHVIRLNFSVTHAIQLDFVVKINAHKHIKLFCDFDK